MTESAFKITRIGYRIMFRALGDTGDGMMLLAKTDAQHLLILIQGKINGTVNCYNGNQLEAVLEVANGGDRCLVFTAIDRAGREESYPVELTGGVMFQVTCAHADRMEELEEDLSRAIATIAD